MGDEFGSKQAGCAGPEVSSAAATEISVSRLLPDTLLLCLRAPKSKASRHADAATFGARQHADVCCVDGGCHSRSGRVSWVVGSQVWLCAVGWFIHVREGAGLSASHGRANTHQVRWRSA